MGACVFTGDRALNAPTFQSNTAVCACPSCAVARSQTANSEPALAELYLWPVPGITQGRSCPSGADFAFQQETAFRVSPRRRKAIVFEARARIFYNIKFVH